MYIPVEIPKATIAFIDTYAKSKPLLELKTDFKTINVSLEYRGTLAFYTPKSYTVLFHEDLQIQLFVEKHGIQDAVLETIALIGNFFPASDIKFELYTDHEWDKETLFIYVLTDFPIRESSKIMVSMFKHLKALKNRTFCKYVSIVDLPK